MKRRIIFILILPLIFSACGRADSGQSGDTKAPQFIPPAESRAEIPLQETFFKKDIFLPALEHSQNIKLQDNVRAVIVPHHLLAANFISDTIKAASRPEIDQVIVIGPNHENLGNEFILTTLANWRTDFGTLHSNRDLVDSLIVNLDITTNDQAFGNEHSIGAQASFIKYYLPQASTAAIILSSYTGAEQVNQLSDWLANHIDDKTLVIFSIDFSHYLNKFSAEAKDVYTRQLIEAGDIAKVLQLNNDHVDSPATLALALALAKKLNLSTNILQHGNSFDFSEAKSESTTSYFAISFTATNIE